MPKLIRRIADACSMVFAVADHPVGIYLLYVTSEDNAGFRLEQRLHCVLGFRFLSLPLSSSRFPFGVDKADDRQGIDSAPRGR